MKAKDRKANGRQSTSSGADPKLARVGADLQAKVKAGNEEYFVKPRSVLFPRTERLKK